MFTIQRLPMKILMDNSDDTNGGTIFTPQATSNVTQMNNFLQDQFPFITTDQMRQIDINYPVAEQFPNTGLYWRAVSNAYGEMRYMCPGLYISAQYSKSNTPNWNYRYNVQDPAQVAEGLGVPHTVEVNAIWGPQNVNGGAPASYSTLLHEHIVPVMQGYWTSFIRAHDPNTYRLSGTPEWDQFDASSMNRIKFETNTTSMEIVNLGMQTRCTYLEGIGPGNQQSTLQPPS
jgi:carboxylesterase type B